MRRSTRAAHLAMLLFVACVASSFSVGERLAQVLDARALTFVRFAMAAAVFYAIARTCGVRLVRPSRDRLAVWCWLGLLLLCFFVSMFAALSSTDAVDTSMVFSLAPLLTAVISRLLLGQRLRLVQSVWLALAALAALWLISGASWQRLLQFRFGHGEWLFLFGTLAYSAYAPCVRRLHGGEPLLSLTFWTTLCGLALLALVSIGPLSQTSWSSLSVGVWLGLIHLVLASTVLTFYLIQYASLTLPAAKVMAYVYLTPVFVLAYETALGDALPPPQVLAGVAVLIVAMLALQLSQDPQSGHPQALSD